MKTRTLLVKCIDPAILARIRRLVPMATVSLIVRAGLSALAEMPEADCRRIIEAQAQAERGQGGRGGMNRKKGL